MSVGQLAACPKQSSANVSRRLLLGAVSCKSQFFHFLQISQPSKLKPQLPGPVLVPLRGLREGLCGAGTNGLWRVSCTFCNANGWATVSPAPVPCPAPDSCCHLSYPSFPRHVRLSLGYNTLVRHKSVSIGDHPPAPKFSSFSKNV